jgi:hypothetical protein
MNDLLNMKRCSKLIIVIVFVEVVLAIWCRLVQPLCEPCLDCNDCPPCISNLQILIIGLMILTISVGIILYIICHKREMRNKKIEV